MSPSRLVPPPPSRPRARGPAAVFVLVALGALACSPGSTSGGSDGGSTGSGGAIDPTAIPVGDGHVGTTPKVGYVDSCTTNFRGGGAEHVGPWLDSANGTWNSTTKLSVQGTVSWPTASYQETTSGDSRVLTFNDLPIDHTTGTYPIARTDPAYQYDTNPNTIVPQQTMWTLPLNPTAASTPHCLGLGPIGILVDGVYLFNSLDAAGRDAGAHEVLDACGEHPESTGALHHHFVPSCLTDGATASATLVGYAADGYGIYVERDADGHLLTNAALDVCHGRTSTVPWNGQEQSVYHYVATLEYPYTLGCYHGTPINTHTGG